MFLDEDFSLLLEAKKKKASMEPTLDDPKEPGEDDIGNKAADNRKSKATSKKKTDDTGTEDLDEPNIDDPKSSKPKGKKDDTTDNDDPADDTDDDINQDDDTDNEDDSTDDDSGENDEDADNMDDDSEGDGTDDEDGTDMSIDSSTDPSATEPIPEPDLSGVNQNLRKIQIVEMLERMLQTVDNLKNTLEEMGSKDGKDKIKAHRQLNTEIGTITDNIDETIKRADKISYQKLIAITFYIKSEIMAIGKVLEILSKSDDSKDNN